MPHPNILLFLTDDHGAWANGSYGNTEIHSPILDHLAAQGVRFSNALTPSPVCSPARACLLTGLTPSQVGIHDWLQEAEPDIGDHDWLADHITLPELLNQAGYFCGLSGKWHLGQSHTKPRGFDWYFGLPRWQGSHIGTYSYIYQDTIVSLTGNKTQFITDYALHFLDQVPSGQSFFLQVGYIATHSPYSNQEPALVEQYNQATFREIPPYVPHPWHKNEGFVQGDTFDPAACTWAYRNYYAAVTDIDRNVGRILDKLQALGQLENTLVIYTSDHGLALGHNGFWGKGNSTRPLNMYEVSLRIPLILSWSRNLAHGHTVHHCVDHYDTFQTICDIAEISPPASGLLGQTPIGYVYPGRSYLSLALGRNLPEWNETRYGEYGDLRMIRTPQFKLIQRYPGGPDDLFDLLNDAEERVNLAGQPEIADIEATLHADLESYYGRYTDPTSSGLRVKKLRRHNAHSEAWRDGKREARGLQIY